MINKLVIENLKHRPARTLLSVLAIGVEVTLVLTLVGLSHGMLDDFEKRSRGVGADVIIRPPGSSVFSMSTAPMSDKLVPFFASQPNVAQAIGVITHTLPGLFGSVTGIDLASFNTMSGGFRFLEGGSFRKDDDVIVDEYYARQGKHQVGKWIELANRKWQICGIVESGKMSRLFVQLPVLQDLSGNKGKLSQIYLRVNGRANVDPLVKQLRETPSLKDYQIYSLEEFTSLISINNVPWLTPFIRVIVGIAVIVGFIVVFLSMYTAVLERTREIGILKSLGASPALIVNLLARETTLLAILGSGAGIGFSYGTRWLIQTLVPASLQQAIVYEWWPIAAGIAVAGALVGALYPGFKAARQDAIQALAYE